MAEHPQSGAMKELDPLIGLTISGRYRVHALLGQGGMGKVFQAQQIPLGRSVALKVLEASRVDQEFSRRFFQEAAILAKLQSRHTVTIYDYGRDGDIYFIAMELVTGGPLDRVLAAEGPFPPRRALLIAQQICRSLREAHAQGVIHRDLKPANVVLTQAEDGDELAKVLDFGLAKRVDRHSDHTQTDVVPGSPKYMAPEVIRQLPIDGRVDMYALGVILYQMLTGAVPFDRPAAMDILVAHLHEAPPPMRAMNPRVKVPEALERVVMRCLDKAPERRFADMQELLETLRGLTVELGYPSDPSWAGPSVKPPSRPTPPSQPRASNAPAPRIAAQDLVGHRAPARNAAAPSRLAFGVLAVAVLVAMLVGAALLLRGSEPDPLVTRPLPPIGPTAPPAQPAETAAPDMVFSAEDVAQGNAVKVAVSSEPPGATVFVRGKVMGTTPTTFELRDAQAKIGSPLLVVLRREGYVQQTVRRTVEANGVTVNATLEAVKAAPSAVPAAERPGRPLGPVLVVKPTEGDQANAAPEDEGEEPEEPSVVDEPPPTPQDEPAEEEEEELP